MEIGSLVRHKIKNKIGVITTLCQPVRCVGIMYNVYIDGRDMPCHHSELEILCK